MHYKITDSSTRRSHRLGHKCVVLLAITGWTLLGLVVAGLVLVSLRGSSLY